MTRKTVCAIYPATPAQQGFILGSLTSAPSDSLFLEQAVFPLYGPLESTRLQDAYRDLVASHEILRTGFAWDLADQPQQVVLERVDTSVEMLDSRGLAPHVQEEVLRRILRSHCSVPFDLSRPPLLRLALHRVDEMCHELVWTHHHAILDGWAQLLLVRELLRRYDTAGDCPPSPRPFGTYAQWLAGQPTHRQREYWVRQLAGYQPLAPFASLPVPADRFGCHTVSICEPEVTALTRFAQAHATTASAAILGCWGLIAARQHAREDIAVGVTLSGRSVGFPDAQAVIGPVATTVPLRLVPGSEERAGDWISHLQSLLADADENSLCSTADLYAWADVPEGQALYASVLSIANYPHAQDPHGPGCIGPALETTAIRSRGGRTRHPLALVVEMFAGVHLRLVNDRSRVSDDQAGAALQCLEAMLGELRPGAEPSVNDLRAHAAGLVPFASSSPDPEPPIDTTVHARSGSLVDVVADAFAAVLGGPVGPDTDFMSAGGHSLLALRLISRLRDALAVDLTLGDLLAAGTPRAMAARVRALALADSPSPEPLVPLSPGSVEPTQPFPLTGIQQAYWAGRTADFDLGGVDSHLYAEVDFDGIDLARLANVWNTLILRHAMLRAVVTPEGEQQVLTDVPSYQIEVWDLRSVPEPYVELVAIRDRLSHVRRDTGIWPLFSIEAALLPAGGTRLFLSFDLLIGDALSWQILYREARRLYDDPQCSLPELNLTYADYVRHLSIIKASSRYDRDRRYWKARLAELPSPPALPLLAHPGSRTGLRFCRFQAKLSAMDLAVLREVGSRHGTTLSALLLAAFGETLGRFTNTTRFLINVTVFHRLDVHPQINLIVGDFTSTVLTTVDLAASTFAERLRALQRQLWSDLDHSLYSGVDVLRDLRDSSPERAMGTAPVVFTSTLDLDTRADNAGDPFPGTIGYGIGQTPQVLLDYQTYEVAGELVINIDAVLGAFPDGFVRCLFDDHVTLIRALIDFPDAPHRPRLTSAPSLPALPDALGRGRLLHGPFLDQVHCHPERVAVVSDGRRVTYAELLDHATGLASRIAEVQPAGELVAILLDPGWEQAAAALGVLLAGYAFVPLDPMWPEHRIRELLTAVGASVVVSRRASGANLDVPPGISTIWVEDEPFVSHPVGGSLEGRTRGDDDLAYVIFTSGSTGAPKGVMISHRGVMNTVCDINERFGVGPGDVLLGLSPFSFDLAVYDIFGTLAAGATLVVPTREERTDPTAWITLIQDEQVSVWNTVPVLMELLLEALPATARSMATLRVCLLSGDWIPVDLPGRIHAQSPGCRVISLGGATEGSIWSILYEVGEVEPGAASIPYGRAMTGQTVEILDDMLLPCPPWTTGEIYIGGHGVALGYWAEPELTGDAFVLDGRTGRRLYRTGDWGRVRADGQLEFLGRRDAQVKIRGYRVELREVEVALASISGVEQAAVVAVGGRGAQRLAGFVVTSRQIAELGAELRERLPDHMVPSTLTALAALPLNTTSKVDRAALVRAAATTSDPGSRVAVPEEADVDARTRPVQEVLAGLLPVAPGPDDDLISLGLTSVDIIRLANTVEKHHGRRPDLTAFYRTPTLRTLVARSGSGRETGSTKAPAPCTAAGTPWTGWDPITDPAERAAFRAERPSFPQLPPVRTFPERPPLRSEARALRFTPRSFTADPVSLNAFAGLLDSMRRASVHGRNAFLYPSGGGLYNVQVHVHVRPGRVEHVTGGMYTYHPVAHDLVPLVTEVDLDTRVHLGLFNRPAAEQAAFTFFLATDPADSAPLYGAEAESLSLLNAGYMGQLLCQSATDVGLGLCPVHGIDFDAVRWLFPNGGRLILLHALLGGIPRSPLAPQNPQEDARE